MIQSAKPMFHCLLVLLTFCLSAISAQGTPYKHIPLAMHVHSTFSSGQETIEKIVHKARSTNLKGLVMTDHDVIAAEYGIPPFRNVLKYRQVKPSLLHGGLKRYLSTIQDLNTQYSDFIIIPGTESAPFYYWEGSLQEGLTLMDWRRHLIIVGMFKPSDYYGLPVLHGRFKTRYITHFAYACFIFILAFFLAVGVALTSGQYRLAAAVIAFISVLGIIHNHPFKSSKYSPFSSMQGEMPYQEVINYANSIGALVYWAHPESNRTSEKILPFGHWPLISIQMKTNKYASVLLSTHHYTGFEALYGDTIHLTKPDMEWDHALDAYLRKERDLAPWGITGLDYHRETHNAWQKIDSGETVVLTKAFTVEAILDGLRNGHNYNVFNGGPSHAYLSQFTVDTATGGQGISGDFVKVTASPTISVTIDITDDPGQSFTVTLIKNGKMWRTFNCDIPCKTVVSDKLTPDEKGYYRLMAKSDHYEIVANPIFFYQ